MIQTVERVTPTRHPKLDLDQAKKAKADGLHRALAQMGYSGLRDVQQIPVDNILCNRDILCIAPTGAGKCLGRGTPVMKADGSVVPVEDIRPGDNLMGPDGSPRRVTSTCSGVENLYLVKQLRGDDYVVNESHILSLQLTGMKSGDRALCGGRYFGSGDIANVSVVDYLAASKTFRHVAKGWKSGEIPQFHRAGVGAFHELPAYMLGLWLGDGADDGFKITTADAEVVLKVLEFAEQIGHLVTVDASGDRCPSYSVVSPTGKCSGAGNQTNTPKRLLRALGLLNAKSKHIPDAYRLSNSGDRAALLAGLIDSDGHLSSASSYEFTSKYQRLAEDCAFVARSLGLHATVSVTEKECTNNGVWGTYWRVYISGDIHKIPVILPRKKANVRHFMVTNPLRTGISLEPLGPGQYFGFELAGPDRLFLLGDFTVTHNTAMFVVPILALNWKALVFSPLQALMRDQVEELQRRGVAADFINATMTAEATTQSLNNWANGRTQMLYVAPERLNRDDFRSAMTMVPPDMVVIDEAHCLHQWGENFRSSYHRIGDFIEEFNPKQVSAFTATCTEEIEADICRVTGISPVCTLWQYYRRENLTLKSLPLTSDYDIYRDCERIDGKIIIYFATIKELESFAPQLQDHLNEPVGIFHSKLPGEMKQHLQDSFKRGDIRIICATNAFGLGVNVEDTRAVIHHDPPGNPEALTQEMGRAGRDGLPAECIVYYHSGGWRTQENFIESGNPSEKMIREIYQVLYNLGKDGSVIRKTGPELAEMAKVSSYGIYAIMETLKANRVIQNVESTNRMAKISFVGSSEDKRFKEYRDLIIKGGRETGSSFIEVSLDWLRQQIGVQEAAVTRWLKQWDSDGLISYKAPFNGQPRVLIGDISNIDFKRLKRKGELAWEKLDKVKQFVEIPDHEKHDWLQDYFAHWTNA
jgi:superfamily II DNA/RNA helicase